MAADDKIRKLLPEITTAQTSVDHTDSQDGACQECPTPTLEYRNFYI